MSEGKKLNKKKMKQKNTIVIVIGIMFLISFVSAISITAGENYTFSVDTTDNLFWDVVNNQSNMDGFEVRQDIYDDYSNITLSTDYRMKPDSFTIIFIDNSTKEIIKEVPVYSGGRSSRVIEKNVTEYIKVDNYIDKEIEVIVEVENTEKIKELERKIKKEKYFFVIIFLFSTLFIIYLLKEVKKK